MQPSHNYMYGPVPAPYGSGRFAPQPYGYVPRGRMSAQAPMYRSSAAAGRPPLLAQGNPATAAAVAQQQQHHQQHQQQQSQQGGSGASRSSGVLPNLQASHAATGTRGLAAAGGPGGGGDGHISSSSNGSSSGTAAPRPMPPTSSGGTFMRRPPVPMRQQQQQQMPYQGAFPRGMPVGGGGLLFSNPASHPPTNVMIHERQGSGGFSGPRADMPMKPAGVRGMGSSLPLLPGMADPHLKYPVPPHMMHHSFIGTSMPPYPAASSYGFVPHHHGGGNGSTSSLSGNNSSVGDHNTATALTTTTTVSTAAAAGESSGAVNKTQSEVVTGASIGASSEFNKADLFAIEMDADDDGDVLNAADAATGTLHGVLASPTAALSDGQNGCSVNTPPLATSDDDAGLTPTPPTLRFLSRYEEEEVKEYMPHVYFGGTEQCRKINAVRGAERNDGFDDDNFHYRVVVGDHLVYRYEVLRILGQGTFGIVVQAMDHKTHAAVAIKIIKNKPNYTKQAQEEIKTLERLNGDDPHDEANIVRLLDSCVFRQHYLLVFELLPSDLYALIQSNKFKPFSREFIYELSEQLLTALVHVRKHRFVHCDLKPENIMISEGDPGASGSEPVDFELKLIDFGSACEESRPLFTYIQSRYYRAPEIVLGIPYTTAIDMWSFGCVLCELANGYPIFPASSEGELLERIVEYAGPIPPYLIRKGRRSERFFTDEKMKPNLSKKRAAHPPRSRALRNFLKIARTEEDQLFLDFVAGCLTLDAEERLTPEAALEHPWMDQWRSFSAGTGLSDASSSVRED